MTIFLYIVFFQNNSRKLFFSTLVFQPRLYALLVGWSPKVHLTGLLHTTYASWYVFLHVISRQQRSFLLTKFT